MKDYIVYKCNTCNKHFILFKNEVKHSEAESKYITCPFHGKHKSIIVCGAYEDIKGCMSHDSFKKESGRVKQKRWS